MNGKTPIFCALPHSCAHDQVCYRTDARLDVIDGKREQLAGEIQHAYGVSKEEAEEQIREFEKNQAK